MLNHRKFLDIAWAEAKAGKSLGERGAGAVLVKEGEVITQSRDRRKELNDPIAVPEMDCIRRAGRRSDQPSLTLYTTRYPDMLCAGTVIQFSIGGLVIGLPETENPAINFLRQKQVPIQFVEHKGCMAMEVDYE